MKKDINDTGNAHERLNTWYNRFFYFALVGILIMAILGIVDRFSLWPVKLDPKNPTLGIEIAPNDDQGSGPMNLNPPTDLRSTDMTLDEYRERIDALKSN